jgi:hypothetical protein
MRRVEDRYCNDANFHQFVQMMQRCIEELHLTPSEVREAAVFACVRLEMMRSRASIEFDPETLELRPVSAPRFNEVDVRLVSEEGVELQARRSSAPLFVGFREIPGLVRRLWEAMREGSRREGMRR